MGFTIDPQVIQGHQLQQDHQQFAESFPVVCGLVIAAAAQHRQLLRRRDRLQSGAKVGLAPGGRDGAGDPKKKVEVNASLGGHENGWMFWEYAYCYTRNFGDEIDAWLLTYMFSRMWNCDEMGRNDLPSQKWMV